MVHIFSSSYFTKTEDNNMSEDTHAPSPEIICITPDLKEVVFIQEEKPCTSTANNNGTTDKDATTPKDFAKKTKELSPKTGPGPMMQNFLPENKSEHAPDPMEITFQSSAEFNESSSDDFSSIMHPSIHLYK